MCLCTDNYGHNAAHFAAQHGHLDILRALRNWNVDVSATTNDGWNAAHLAAEAGHLDILRALRDWNVDVSATNINGSNPVHFAAWKGHLHILTELKPWWSYVSGALMWAWISRVLLAMLAKVRHTHGTAWTGPATVRGKV